MTVIHPSALVFGLALLLAVTMVVVRYGQPGTSVSRGLRLAMLALLLAGAASPLVSRRGSGRLRVHVLDVSGSHHEAASAALGWLANLSDAGGGPDQVWPQKGDRAALVLFDSRAWLAVPPSPLPEFAARCGALVSGLKEGQSGSDLEAGLQQGARVAATVEPGAAELLLISDGCHLGAREPLLAAARDCLALGSRVLVLEPGAWGGKLGARPGVAVVGLSGPGQVGAGESVAFAVEVRSTAAAFSGQVALRVEPLHVTTAGAQPLVSRPCVLRSGSAARFRLTLPPLAAGLYQVEAFVAGPGDTRSDGFAADDRRHVLLRVGRRGLALVFASPGRVQAPDRDALLGAAGLDWRLAAWDAAETSGGGSASPGWAVADLIVIDGVSRDELGDDVARRLRELVVAGGAGLLVLGGDRGFVSGGWQSSPLADILPVHPDPEESVRLAVVVCLDASGSMAEPWTAGRAESRWQRAVGALLPTPVLRPAESLVVVPFDARAREPIALGRGERSGEVFAQALLELRPRGGTDCFAALARAREVAESSGAERRVIVLLSDGDTRESDEDYRQLEAIRRSDPDTRVRVLAVEGGGDESVGRLRRIARAAGGELRAMAGWDEIVGILREEVLGEARGLVGRGPAPVTVVTRGPLGADLPAVGMPPLGRWNRTRARDAVPPLLVVGERREPLLAVAPAGAGRAVALTSVLADGWADSWLSADAPGAEVARRWLTDAVAWARRGGHRSGLSVTAQALGEGRVEVTAVVEAEQPWQGAGQARQVLVARLGSSHQALVEVEPGRFLGNVERPASGLSDAALVVVEEISPASGLEPERDRLRGSALVKPVSAAEWRRLEPDTALLRATGAAGGGELVGPRGHAAVSSADRLLGYGSPLELRPWLVGMAVVLLLAEAFLRRGARVRLL